MSARSFKIFRKGKPLRWLPCQEEVTLLPEQ